MAKLEVLKPKAQTPGTAPADPRPEPRTSVPAIPQSPVPATGRIQVSTQEIDVFRLGDTLARSGYFTEARDAAKAVVKILTGRELGFGPIASMTGLFISPGDKPCLHANMMSARIKSAPGFDYEIRKLDNTVCEIAVLRNGKVVEPVISFSMEDAQTTGLDHHHRIVEIAGVDDDKNILVSTLFNPGIPIPPKPRTCTGSMMRWSLGRQSCWKYKTRSSRRSPAKGSSSTTRPMTCGT